MAHPMRKAVQDGINAKMRKMTDGYGSASRPANNRLAPTNREKDEGPEDAIGFGAESAEPSRGRGDRAGRRQVANPVATYRKGGRVRKKADGGDVSPIEQANRNQAMSDKGVDRARGGRTKPKGATNVNVIIAPQGGGAGTGAPPPGIAAVPPVLPPPHPPMPPMAGPPPGMPPMGAKPPMGGAMPPPGMPMAPGAPGGMPPGLIPPRKAGGRVAEQEDPTARTRKAEGPVEARARGGRMPHMTAGAATGIGRLEKIGEKPKAPGKPQKV